MRPGACEQNDKPDIGSETGVEMVKEELSHPNDPKEEGEEKEEVETRKAKTEKVKIITI